MMLARMIGLLSILILSMSALATDATLDNFSEEFYEFLELLGDDEELWLMMNESQPLSFKEKPDATAQVEEPRNE